MSVGAGRLTSNVHQREVSRASHPKIYKPRPLEKLRMAEESKEREKKVGKGELDQACEKGKRVGGIL